MRLLYPEGIGKSTGHDPFSREKGHVPDFPVKKKLGEPAGSGLLEATDGIAAERLEAAIPGNILVRIKKQRDEPRLVPLQEAIQLVETPISP